MYKIIGNQCTYLCIDLWSVCSLSLYLLPWYWYCISFTSPPPPPLITKIYIPVMIHGTGIIFWADHVFGQDILFLCQYSVGNGIIIDV